MTDRPQLPAIGEILESQAQQIIDRWLKLITEQKDHADPHRREDVIDEMQRLLRSLGRALQEQSPDALLDGTFKTL